MAPSTAGVVVAHETPQATLPRSTIAFLYSPLPMTLMSIGTSCAFIVFWSAPAAVTAQVLRLFYYHLPNLDLFAPKWYRPGVMYGSVASAFILIYALQSLLALAWGIAVKYILLGRQKHFTDAKHARLYSQRQQLYSALSRVLRRGNASGGVLEYITGTVYTAW